MVSKIAAVGFHVDHKEAKWFCPWEMFDPSLAQNDRIQGKEEVTCTKEVQTKINKAMKTCSYQWRCSCEYITDISHTPPGGLIRYYRSKEKLRWHTHTNAQRHYCTYATEDLALKTFLFLSASSTRSRSMGPIFSPIKSLIALGNKDSINSVSANKTPAVWSQAANMQQSPALLVVDIMSCVSACCQHLLFKHTK